MKLNNDVDVDSVLNSDSDYAQTDSGTMVERFKKAPTLCRDKRLLRVRTEIAKILEQEETSSDSGIDNIKNIPTRKPKYSKSQASELKIKDATVGLLLEGVSNVADENGHIDNENIMAEVLKPIHIKKDGIRIYTQIRIKNNRHQHELLEIVPVALGR